MHFPLTIEVFSKRVKVRRLRDPTMEALRLDAVSLRQLPCIVTMADVFRPLTKATTKDHQASVFSTDDISPMEILGLKALQHLIDDAVKTFDRAEVRVEETDKRVLKWPPWKRRLWVLWKSILVNPE